jgi:gamma-glutamyltranspeptidase / glutathione hydrolase
MADLGRDLAARRRGAREPGRQFRNPVLADTWRASWPRPRRRRPRGQIEAARDAFYRGFVAEAIDGYFRDGRGDGRLGPPPPGVLTGDDLAGYSAHVEAPLTSTTTAGRSPRPGPWGQGPVLLQALAMLKGFDVAAMDPAEAGVRAPVVEAMKLAYADREAYYGDPDFAEVPLEHAAVGGLQRRARGR